MTPLELMSCYGRTTIRAWSRRTLRCACHQLMVCQGTSVWEDAPAGRVAAVICFSSFGWFAKFSRDERPMMEVCLLSHGVMLPDGATPIRSITKRPSLFPSSSTRRPISLPCGGLSLAGE
jgi:hypothetical protein